MSLQTRLEKLEAKHAGPVRIWVAFDDGPYESFNEATGQMESLTREELDARYPDPTVFRVIHVDHVPMTDIERTVDDE